MGPLSEVKRLEYERSHIAAAQRINPQMVERFLRYLNEGKGQQQSEKIESKLGNQPDVNTCLQEVAKEFMHFVQETDPDLARIIENDIKKCLQNKAEESKKSFSKNPPSIKSAILTESLSQEFLGFLKETDPDLADYLFLHKENKISKKSDKQELKSEMDTRLIRCKNPSETLTPETFSGGNGNGMVSNETQLKLESDPFNSPEPSAMSIEGPESNSTMGTISSHESLPKLRRCLINVSFRLDPQVGQRLFQSLVSKGIKV